MATSDRDNDERRDLAEHFYKAGRAFAQTRFAAGLIGVKEEGGS